MLHFLRPVTGLLPNDRRTQEAAENALSGTTHGWRALLPFMGPAFIACIAYVDPGNFATNVQGGSQFGYTLLWVILVANLMAMLIQTLSAKLGIATDHNLAELCRLHFPHRLCVGLWIEAELIAMATDLAEFLGAAIGINLLFHLPMLIAGLVTGFAAYGILALQTNGFRHLESMITALVGVIVVSFVLEVILSRPSGSGIVDSVLPPHFVGVSSVLIGVGILGATVMPHVIYLHSALTQNRVPAARPELRRRIFHFERTDVIIAMTIAGLVNMAMLIMAAAVFNSRGITSVIDMNTTYVELGRQVNGFASAIFGVGLLASGLASSSVGTFAGQVVMQGFIDRRIPIFVRRTLTMIPAMLVIAVGINPSETLVISQVALSFGIAFALIPLLIFTSSRSVMGPLVNRHATVVIGVAVAVTIVFFNLFLIQQTLA